MSAPRVFVVGLGAVTAAGRGVPALRDALRLGSRPLRPLSRFPVPAELRFPVGEVPELPSADDLPPTHALALAAAREALAGRPEPPDAVVLGVTTGGIAVTETLLAANRTDPAAYVRHGAGTVAELLARELGCTGPALTVATACSSGAVALEIALRLLRARRAAAVLAGGADALCRLTYHGFRLLQLVDPAGSRPLDRTRQGLTVAEGAGLLLLVAADEPPAGALAELRGGGLTCDAHHPTQPRPGGEGARQAVERALADAGLAPRDVDYVNLHGTGTRDNDAAEAAALHAVWPDGLPALSSTKGLTGHTLAAAGAVEAVISVLALRDGRLPGNVGLSEPDPALRLAPLREAVERPPRVVVSSSFGFGGNNAVLVLARPELPRGPEPPAPPPELEILGLACLSGAGDTAATVAALREGRPAAGTLDDEVAVRELPARLVRRLRRLPRLALALLDAARRDAGDRDPRAVFFGTAWGPLSETYEFLARLFESEGRFAGPTDFVGSVHNAPAGQLAMRSGAAGPNVTTTAGEASFAQALLLAALLAGPDDQPSLVAGADEFHALLGPRLEPLAAGERPADGGGALLVRPPRGDGVRLRTAYLAAPREASDLPPGLLAALGGADRIRDTVGALLLATPAADGPAAAQRTAEFLACTGFAGPVIDARRLLGSYATVAAAAAAVAARWLREGCLPAALAGGRDLPLAGRRLVVLSLGRRASAVELRRPEATP